MKQTKGHKIPQTKISAKCEGGHSNLAKQLRKMNKYVKSLKANHQISSS